MGRRKQEEVVEAVENLDEQVSEETEIQEESLAEENEEIEAAEEKPKRQRRSRKTKAEVVEAKEEETEEVLSPDDEVAQAVEAAEEVSKETAPKRQRSSRKKVAATPEAQVELATEAMQKTMDEMVKQWTAINDITGHVSAHLEKVAHIVKPSIQDYTNTNDSLVRPGNDRSQFAVRFASAASIVAVLLSLVSMSLSQSARTVALNAEATRVASSQLFASESKRSSGEIAFERAKSAEPKADFQRPKQVETYSPKARGKGKRF